MNSQRIDQAKGTTTNGELINYSNNLATIYSNLPTVNYHTATMKLKCSYVFITSYYQFIIEPVLVREPYDTHQQSKESFLYLRLSIELSLNVDG